MKRHLPVIYNPKINPQRDLNDHGVQEVSMGKGTFPQWIQIAITIIGVIGGGIWYMGKLDTKIDMGFEQTRKGLSTLTEMQKENSKKFAQLAEGTVALQLKATETETKISALEKKTDQIEQRQYQNRRRKRR